MQLEGAVSAFHYAYLIIHASEMPSVVRLLRLQRGRHVMVATQGRQLTVLSSNEAAC
jgi:hypothetical protein